MTFGRRTLRHDTVLEGLGLHGGVPVTVTIHPAQDGIAFRCGAETVAAKPKNVAETHRCTRLGGISTVEHLMAAFAGLEVTDALVELTTPELPALDGSALPWVAAMQEAGFEDLPSVEIPPLFSRIFIQSEGAKLAISAGAGHWRYEYRSDRWPLFQVYGSEAVHQDFPAEIAPARTFGHEADVPAIQAAGLAKGLDLNSALLLGEEGYANASRFDTEPARHKLLDAMGDLYLAGVPVRFLNVVAQRTGHRMNVEAAVALSQAIWGDR